MRKHNIEYLFIVLFDFPLDLLFAVLFLYSLTIKSERNCWFFIDILEVYSKHWDILCMKCMFYGMNIKLEYYRNFLQLQIYKLFMFYIFFRIIIRILLILVIAFVNISHKMSQVLTLCFIFSSLEWHTLKRFSFVAKLKCGMLPKSSRQRMQAYQEALCCVFEFLLSLNFEDCCIMTK